MKSLKYHFLKALKVALSILWVIALSYVAYWNTAASGLTTASTTLSQSQNTKTAIDKLTSGNLETKTNKEWTAWSQGWNNDKLQRLKTHDSNNYKQFAWDINETEWARSIYFFLVKIAKDLKDIFFIIATIYFLIIVLRFLFSSWGDDDIDKFRKWVIWITIWIIVMQLSYSFVELLFDQWSENGLIDGKLAYKFYDIFLSPLIALIKTVAAFFFITMGIIAFYKLITANWNDEAIKSWKMTVFYAIIGFLLIKISDLIINWAYKKTLCRVENDISEVQWICTNTESISTLPLLALKIINWINGFVWIIIMLMLIYTWFKLIFSHWEEEEVKKAKSTVIYIIVGMLILLINYFILSLLVLPNTASFAS